MTWENNCSHRFLFFQSQKLILEIYIFFHNIYNTTQLKSNLKFKIQNLKIKTLIPRREECFPPFDFRIITHAHTQISIRITIFWHILGWTTIPYCRIYKFLGIKFQSDIFRVVWPCSIIVSTVSNADGY